MLQYFVIIARVIFISHFSERGRKENNYDDAITIIL